MEFMLSESFKKINCNVTLYGDLNHGQNRSPAGAILNGLALKKHACSYLDRQ